jgi:hypothetical protein
MLKYFIKETTHQISFTPETVHIKIDIVVETLPGSLISLIHAMTITRRLGRY